jgi:hypothetical protein
MGSSRLPSPLVLFGLACAPACAAKRPFVPESLATSRGVTDLSLPPDAHAPVAPNTLRELSDVARRYGATAGCPTAEAGTEAAGGRAPSKE